MLPDKVITWFLPSNIRHDKTQASFYEMYGVVVANIIGCVVMSLIPLLLLYFNVGARLWTYYLAVATYFITLLSLRLFGHWRLPTYVCAGVAYYIVYTWLEHTGMIYSPNITMLHMYIIAAILVDRKWGWLTIFTNLIFLGIIYSFTVNRPATEQLSATLGSPVYTLLMHMIITVFLGGFFASAIHTQEINRRKINHLQNQRINMLDEAVQKRTEQLNSMRQTIATDFHDQTGNMLAAINRQAAMLELKLSNQPDMLPLVKSIITNSDELYASSKDFLWNLNHDSDNPLILFHYLTGYGQRFYNQFDISFSATVSVMEQPTQQLNPFAALNLIYIFKEAMSNVIKHSGADEVTMTMTYEADTVIYILSDNGQWKMADPGVAHYGLTNIERRCRQSGFEYKLSHSSMGTSIAISLPLSIYFINNEDISKPI